VVTRRSVGDAHPRHTYASLLIAQGVNVAFASRQLGHASITTTLNTYTHLFDHVQHAATVIGRLEERFAHVLENTNDTPPPLRLVVGPGPSPT